MSTPPSDTSDESKSDATLLQRYFSGGDREAMDELFRRHADTAYRLAFADIENAADAEEIVQMAFLKVLLNESKDIGNVRGWIMRIVVDTCRNKVRDEVRLRKRQQAASADRAASEVPNEEKAELLSAAIRAVKALPKNYRLPVWLHYLEGLSFDEVGCALSLPEGTVRQQANRGIEQIRQSLGQVGYTGSVAALPGLLATATLTPAPAAMTASFKALIATKSLSGSLAAGAVPAKVATTASVKLVAASVVLAATAAFAGIKYHGGGASAPKDDAKPVPVAVSNPVFEQFFGPQTDWPRYRGPSGNGVTAEKNLPVKWSKTENIVWPVDIPYENYPCRPYSSPIVYKDKVFISLGNIKPAEHLLACFNKSDGKKLWVAKIELGGGYGIGAGSHSDEFSYSSPTPCTDGERVYAVYASGVVAAVDYEGKVVWRQEVNNKVNFEGLCTSPILYKDLVVVICNANSNQSGNPGVIIGYDRKTGEVKYRAGHGGWYLNCSPVPALIKDEPVILFNTRTQIEGINPENGTVRWFAAQQKQDRHMSASVGVGDGIVYGGHGDRDGIGGMALPLEALAGAKGDVTSKAKWSWKTDYPHFIPGESLLPGCSPLVSGGYVYDMANWDVITCIEVATGKVMYTEKIPPREGEKPGAGWWSGKHLPGWGNNAIATADGLIYFISSERSIVLKAGPKFEVVGASELDDGNFSDAAIQTFKPYNDTRGRYYAFNSAAVSGGRIFVQGHNKLWCIGNK
jgi:RNA polymerase sigma factor (sigma-70 family)